MKILKYIFLFFLFASNGVCVTTYTATIGAGKDYTTITAWLNSFDNLVTGDSCVIGQIESSALTEDISFSGHTTDATHWIKLTVATANMHNGTESSGFTLTSSNNGTSVITIADSFVTIEKMIIYDADDNAISITATTANNILIRQNIIRDGGNNGVYIQCATGGSNFDIEISNNIIYNCDEAGIYFNTNSNTGYAYNNTVYNCNTDVSGTKGGIVVRYMGCIAINNLCFENGTEDYNDDVANGKFSNRSGFNVSSDATAPGGFSLTSKTNTDYFTNVTGGSEDFHLKNDADNLAIGTGYNLTDSLTVDIDDTTRPIKGTGNFWCRGADETHYTTKFQRRKVHNSGDGYWNGMDKTYTKLKEALSDANACDWIIFAPGRYDTVLNVSSYSNFHFFGGFNGTDTTLDSRGGFQDFKDVTIIDADSSGRITTTGNSQIYNGFRFVNAYVTGDGAAFYVYEKENVIISYCVIDSCRASARGSGILYDSGTDKGFCYVHHVIAIHDSCTCGVFEFDETVTNSVVDCYSNIAAFNDSYGFEVPWHEGVSCDLEAHFWNNISWNNNHGSGSNNPNIWMWARNRTTFSYCSDSAWVADTHEDDRWEVPDASIIFQYDGNNFTGVGDPGFQNLDDLYFMLRRNSPCRGTGKNGSDMGCFDDVEHDKGRYGYLVRN